MLNTPTMDKLRALKFTGMLKGLEIQMNSTEIESCSFDERLGLLVDLEMEERENRRLRTRLTQAKLRQQACMEDLDYKANRGLDRSLIQSLHSCKWIKEGLNVLITGPTGVGKSYLACALGHRACLAGYKVGYYRTSRLFEELRLAAGDGRYPKLLKSISKQHLIILDDWGLSNLKDRERTDLLEILEDRHGIHSTIITGQLPIEHWHEVIGNPTLADAILDRVVHNAYCFNLDGDSMRKHKIKD